MKIKMNNLLKALIVGFAVVTSGALMANDGTVTVRPGTISGSFVIPGLDTSKSCYQGGLCQKYITARYNSPSVGTLTTNYNSGGDLTYSMTVNVPPDENVIYSLQSVTAYVNNYRTYYNFNQMLGGISPQVPVEYQQTSTYDFEIPDAATLSGNISVTSTTGAAYQSAYISVQKQFGTSWRSVAQVTPDANGNYSLVIPGGEIRLTGSVTLANSQGSRPLETKLLTVQAGQEVVQDWSLSVELDLPGSLSGSFSPVHPGGNNLTNIYLGLYGPQGANKWLSRSTGGDFSIDGMNPGLWQFGTLQARWGSSYLNFPYSKRGDAGYYIDIASNTNTEAGELATPLSVIRGKIDVYGSIGLASTTYLNANAYGAYECVYQQGVEWPYYCNAAYGGNSSQSLGSNSTGNFALVVSEGKWEVNRSLYLNFRESSPYLNANFSYTNYQAQPVTVASGQNVFNQNTNIGTGTVTVRFAADVDFSSPRVYARCYDRDPNGVLLAQGSGWSYGSGGTAREASVKVVNIGGDCTLRAEARVGGGYTTFAEFEVEIIEGSDIIVDAGGPSLNVIEPVANSYTTADTVVVSGLVTDKDPGGGIASVSVNGEEVSFELTGEADNEVSFSASVSLVEGPNVIDIQATDISDKLAATSIRVYRDGAAPTVSWTPESGTVTGDDQIEISGVASDDVEVQSITVDGSPVSFTSTNNPADGNEVSFSTLVNLYDGDNEIEVIVKDTSRRSTSDTHIITQAIVTNNPPVANAGSDQTLECTGEITDASLDGSGSSDPDGDPLDYLWSGEGQLVSGASASVEVALGDSSFTLTVTDDSGESDSDDVSISVVDTTSPDLTASADQVIEATSPDGAAFTVEASATDVCDPAPSVDITGALGVYPIGETVVDVAAADASGNDANASVSITVQDTTAPEVSLSGVVDTIWPPNHKMVLVATVGATDVADESPSISVSVSSNEALNGSGDGNTDADWVVDGNEIWLRAERSGSGDGRTYTVEVTAEDASGNSTTESFTAVVPHDQGAGNGGNESEEESDDEDDKGKGKGKGKG